MLLGVSRANDGRIVFGQTTTNWADAQVLTVPAGTNVNLEAAAEGKGTIVVVGINGEIFTPSGHPFVLAEPAAQTVTVGQSASWTVQPYATGPFTYQWNKNGTVISGATSATFTLGNVATSDAGSYSVTITNAVGTYTTVAAALTVNQPPPPAGPTAWLSNLSVRTNMSAGQTLIVGFTVSGGTEDILVRGDGPALAATFPQFFSTDSVMADPQLAYYPNGASTPSSTNNDWAATLSSTFAAVGAFPFATGSKDAAFVQSINGPNNTVWVQGTGGGTVLVEAYAINSASSPRLTNISARNHVGTDADILIAGFVLKGSGTKKLLIRGIGPALADVFPQFFSPSAVLGDPKLEIYDGPGNKLAENNDWDSSLATTFDSVGAYRFTSGSKDAAIIVTLPASDTGISYTAQVKGNDGGTGEGVVEIYELP